MTRFDAGDLAIDEDSDESGLLVVLGDTGEKADEYVIWETPGDDPPITAAAKNPGHDPSTPVVEAVYLDDLRGAMDEWDLDEAVNRYDAGSLEDLGVRTYGFPASRLASASADDPR
ncbi:hypothetical protein [Natrarchaeobaculum sulfurireducens]|uniref:Uncharacterized protein n=1 Tax=Natrarchaeobaculum sulfurireducens TaxID=2044521 RepID=A0A346PQK7_9EURY|nr:hypothetical protein [Natrarchaeobaculum sulfurireducens]AXR81802.1 hypothetical protein AArcMg_1794 [Natrarchaeobaculum sulfurireducens]